MRDRKFIYKSSHNSNKLVVAGLCSPVKLGYNPDIIFLWHIICVYNFVCSIYIIYTAHKNCIYITGYGSTLYIGIAMVFVFSPYIWKFTSCFQFQVNLTFNDFTAQNMSKVICVPNISLNYHFLAQ